jgi:hypothetical protein
MDGVSVAAYRVVVSREDPWWIAVSCGAGLPDHGAATETRTISDLEDKVRDLIVLRTGADLRKPYEAAARALDLEWFYELPPDAEAALRDYRDSKADLDAAKVRYAQRAEQAASVLYSDARASVRDIAKLMGISHQRVHQLLSGYRKSRGRRRSTDQLGPDPG